MTSVTVINFGLGTFLVYQPTLRSVMLYYFSTRTLKFEFGLQQKEIQADTNSSRNLIYIYYLI